MLEIFEFDFMIRAFLAGAMIGVIAPLIGAFLVVRRYSFFADTLAHVSLAGVAAGLLMKKNPIVTAMIVSVFSAYGVEKLRNAKKVFGESALALFLWAGLATAIVLFSAVKEFNVDLFSFLFGSITTVTTDDLYLVATLGGVVMALILAFYRQFFIIAFDEEIAKVNGIQVRRYNVMLVMLAAITVSLSMRIVGALLIGALMVIPVVTAMQYNRSFKQTLILASLFSFASVIIGLFISYYFNLASGGTIVLVGLTVFFISYLMNGKK
jgi:zinc transport system permease protein